MFSLDRHVSSLSDSFASKRFPKSFCLSSGFGSAKRFSVQDHQGALSYEAWNKKCEALGGNLAAITNDEEQGEAERAIKGTKRGAVLTGMIRKANGSPVFVDTHRDQVTYA